MSATGLARVLRRGQRAVAPAVASVLVLSEAYSAMAAGAGSLAAGQVLKRASDGGYYSGASAFAESVGGSNVARIWNDGTDAFLAIEGATTNLVSTLSPAVNPRDAWTWANGSGSTEDAAVAAPNGGHSTHHVVTANAYSKYFYDTRAVLTYGQTYTHSCWAKASGSVVAVLQWYYGDVSTYSTPTLTTSWATYSFHVSPVSVGSRQALLIPADGYAHGGQSAGTRNYWTWGHQVEAGSFPSSYTATSRAAEGLEDSTSLASIHGSARVDVTWKAPLAYSDLSTIATLMWICGSDSANCIQLDLRSGRREILLISDGVSTRLPVQLPAFAAGDKIALSITGWGNAAPSGTYRLNGAAAVSLGTGSALPPLRPAGSVLYWFADPSRANPLLGGILSRAIYDLRRAATPTAYYASPSGVGAGTIGDPASLTTGLALMRAASGSRLVLRGGTYYLASTLSLQSGDQIYAYPGETPVLDLCDAITGWTAVGGGVYSASCANLPGEVYCNGSRLTRAKGAVSGWTDRAGGFTAANAAIAGYARPQDVVVHWAYQYEDGFLPVSGASGTAITISATPWARSQSIDGGSTYSAHGAYVDYVENALELCTVAGYWYWRASDQKLFVYPPGGVTLASATVTAATRETVVSAVGSRGAPLTGITLHGITFAGSTWLEPVNGTGYNGAGCGFTGSWSNSSTPTEYQIPGGVHVAYATVTLRACRFTRMGGAGFDCRLGSTVTLESCQADDCGADGFSLGETSATAWTGTAGDATTVIVRECYAAGTGVRYRCSAGFNSGYASVSYSRCEAYNAPYNGWFAGWPLSPVSYPAITIDQCKAWYTNSILTDGGYFYLLGPFTSGTVSACYAESHVGGNYNRHYYLDNNCSNVAVTGCVAKAMAGNIQWAFFNTGSNHNTIAGCWWSALTDVADSGANNTVSGNVNNVTTAGALAVIAAAGRS